MMDYCNEITRLLDRHEERMAGIEKEKDSGYEVYLKAKDNAIRIEQEVVLPPMKKIGELLKAKGNDYKIEETLMQNPPVVTMTVYPKPYNQNHSFLMPSIRFVFDVFDERIRVVHDYSFPGKPHMGRKESRFRECEVTMDIVESEIFSFVHQIFK